MSWFGWPPDRRKRCCSGRDSDLAEECDAFLVGVLAERLADHSAVPVWVWTNLLAHGSDEALRAERDRPIDAASRDYPWREARSYLSVELLGLAGRYGPLGEIQHEALVPLELELASRAEVAHWSPRRWVARVEEALSAYASNAEAS